MAGVGSFRAKKYARLDSRRTNVNLNNVRIRPRKNTHIPTRREQIRNSIIYFAVALAFAMTAFCQLPTAVFAIAPKFVFLTFGLYFAIGGGMCLQNTQGVERLHPSFWLLSIFQIGSAATLLIWFCLGNNTLELPWRILAGALLGPTLLVCLGPAIVFLFFPQEFERLLKEDAPKRPKSVIFRHGE